MKKTKLPYQLFILILSVLPIIGLATMLPVYAASGSWGEARQSEPAFQLFLQQASMLSIAQVTNVESDWNPAHTMMATVYTFTPIDTLLKPGQTMARLPLTIHHEFHVVEAGGFDVSEGIGLWVSDAVAFRSGEIVLLSLTAATETNDFAWTDQKNGPDPLVVIRGGALGNYTIEEGLFYNGELGQQIAFATFLQQTKDYHLASGKPLGELATTLQTRSVSSQRVEAASVRARASTSPTDDPPRWTVPGLELAVKVNINTAQVTAEKPASAFFMAIQRAFRTWSVVESADFTLLYDGETNVKETGYNGENEIVFMHKGANNSLGQAQIWFTADHVIQEVDIWLNDDYQLSVSGEPALNEVDLESVVLHELGHWVPLAHSANPDAVMYSVLGNMETKRTLHADDINALTQLHPCDLPPCIHSIYLTELATPTPAPATTATATPTIAPTRPTPTLIPTQPPTGLDIVYLPYVTH